LSVRSGGKCQHGNDTENQKSSFHWSPRGLPGTIL
jgi:hypothetical protein